MCFNVIFIQLSVLELGFCKGLWSNQLKVTINITDVSALKSDNFVCMVYN